MSGLSKVFMLVDDDSDDVELFEAALRDVNRDCRFFSAGDGAAALQKLLNNEVPTPSFVFLDINMPGMGGWEFLESIKGDARLQQIPVIMFSTSSHPHDVKKALRGGALGFFRKPDSMRDLINVLARISNTPADALPAALDKMPGVWFSKPAGDTPSHR